jgi:hypothetical protein
VDSRFYSRTALGLIQPPMQREPWTVSLEFKVTEAREQTASRSAEFEIECCSTATAEGQLKVVNGRLFEEFL